MAGGTAGKECCRRRLGAETAAQVSAYATQWQENAAHGEIETHYRGFLDSQDTFYVSTLKGVDGVNLSIDPRGTYAKVASAKLSTTKSGLTVADMLDDRVLPLFGSQGIRLERVLTDRDSEFCGRHDEHTHEFFFLAVSDIDHMKTKVKSPTTNGINASSRKLTQTF